MTPEDFSTATFLHISALVDLMDKKDRVYALQILHSAIGWRLLRENGEGEAAFDITAALKK